ncbi:MAG: thermonuclease family protein [Dehalococcoidales bacterium]|nr:thermonuclease family protein [Dehalococcoidales bacterium]
MSKLIFSLILVAIIALSCTPTTAPPESSIKITYKATPASTPQTQIIPSQTTPSSPALVTPPLAKIPTTPSPSQVTTPPAPPPAETTPPLPQVTVTQSNEIEAKVTRIIDGDTIEVEINGKSYKVRYIGIDTPETNKPLGQEATNKNYELVSSKIVKLVKDTSDTDDFGRLLRYVYIGDLFINAELVRLGYAVVKTYPPDIKYEALFLSLQSEAKTGQRGIWARKYVGSKSSDKYHIPSCTWAKKINPENEVWFNSATDAKLNGYSPCGVCKPPASD